MTLDTNRDGMVDPSEIQAFATSQGLDSASASQEFASIDINGDGTLDAEELSHAISEPPASPAEMAPPMADAMPVSAPLDGSLATTKFSATQETTSAKTVVDALTTEASNSEQAEALERKASELRANATHLARQARQQAVADASKAAKAKALEIRASLSAMERKAEVAEVEAAALHAKAHAELVEADELMGVSDTLLKQ